MINCYLHFVGIVGSGSGSSSKNYTSGRGILVNNSDYTISTNLIPGPGVKITTDLSGF